jgi:prepilin-type N-terminal cleavage/methylation domain-containing protein
MKSFKKQGGFTLVEIAIVLVIVGLLLAGVLKGQELIENARIKNMAKDMDSMSAVVRSYQDRYRGFPGDDLTAANIASRGWGVAAFNPALTPVVTPDNLIGAATVNPFDPALVVTSENTQAIRALRHAGFIEGAPTLTTLPNHAGGGLIGLTHTVLGLGATNVVCLNNLTGKQAGAIDRLLDDGVSQTGTIRGTGAAAPVAAAVTVNYVEATRGFTVCRAL